MMPHFAMHSKFQRKQNISRITKLNEQSDDDLMHEEFFSLIRTSPRTNWSEREREKERME